METRSQDVQGKKILVVHLISGERENHVRGVLPETEKNINGKINESWRA